jgi:hypothetical protein
MSGETETSVSGWTVDTLHGHMTRVLAEMDHRYQQRYEAQQEGVAAALAAQEKAVAAALQAADRAVIKAETASEKRFDSVNEFRGAMADQTATLMPRVEAEARLASMTEKLGELADRLNRSEGKGSGLASAGSILVAVISVVFGLAGIALALLK